MALSPGFRLGPYEILAPLGAGGMGEVYRARDTKLDREVAIKILPQSLAADPASLARFEREAKVVAALSHPNILAIHDLGKSDGVTYAVMELLEGENLRQRLASGALPQRKAIEIARQIALGLAAAHEKGIVHRDLKPENLFLTHDGRVKILDFGLARQITLPSVGETESPTVTQQTEPGTVLGTVGYISPEQLRGQPADARSDIFAFGAVLYEMLSGKRAFVGETAIETMNAILRDEPPELSESGRNVPLALDHIVRHCLEKSPEQRFHSAHDIVFDLEEMATGAVTIGLQAASPRAGKKNVLRAAAVGAALLLGIAGILLLRRPHKGTSEAVPFFHQITFRLGNVTSARFAPDGQTIIYAAAWEGNQTSQLFETRPQSPEALRLPIPDADVVSISRSGEMAVLLGLPFSTVWRSGTLARVPLSGGAPRELVKDVQDADWTPDGHSLAVVRSHAGVAPYQLEFPSGRILYKNAAGWISHLRVSPTGSQVAFLDHPILGNDAGSVAVIDRDGNKTTLSDGWLGAQGLAWSASGKEIWFTAHKTEGSRALYGVGLSGRQRLIARTPGNLTLQDISRDGRVLLTQTNWRRGMIGSLADSRERELPALGGAFRPILSDDGMTLLFTEQRVAGGPGYSVYLRRIESSAAVRLGEGDAWALSPDGSWVLAIAQRTMPAQLVMLPTGAGEPRRLTSDAINHQEANFLPDGTRILFVGNEAGHVARVYVQDLSGGKPRPVTPDGVVGTLPTVDGKFIAARGAELSYSLYSVQNGQRQPIRGLNTHEFPMRWSADGRYLYIRPFPQGLPVRILQLDTWTGRREAWKELAPSDASGVAGLGRIALTPDGKKYVYQYDRFLSDLYIVDGLK